MSTTAIVNNDKKLDYCKMLFTFAFITSIAAFGEWASLYMPLYAEWIPFFAVGLGIPLTLALHVLLFRVFEINSRLLKVGLWLICSLPLSIILLVIYLSTFTQWILAPSLSTLSTAILILITSIFTLMIVNREESFLTVSIWARLQYHLIMLIFTLTSWCSILTLPNWTNFIRANQNYPVTSSMDFFTCTVLAIVFIFNKQIRPLCRINKYIIVGFTLITLALFLLLSFRYDSLFLIRTYEFHWGYFVGPIHTVKNGGWLLWDTPSQYGFLNILIASLIPTKTAWQAFYLFQGALLVLAAMMMLNMVTTRARDLFKLSLGLLFIISALYFADPELEGPYAYPSSSVLRFIWCYLFLFLLFQYWKNPNFSLKKLVIYGSISWVAAVLWSVESAIYTTLIFYPALIVALLQNYFSKKQNHQTESIKKTFLLSIIPVLLLLFTLIAISIYYQISLGHLPDWKSFVIYGFSYASGFGAIPLNLVGSVWILLLLIISLSTIAFNLLTKNPRDRALVLLFGMIFGLWAISSYFIGRSVPNNITAILPILFTLIALTLNVIEDKQLYFPSLLIKISAIPLLSVILLTTLGNSVFIERMKPFQTLTGDVTQQVQLATDDLLPLIKTAGISAEDPIVYYGYTSAVRFNKTGEFRIAQHTWLPSPLQLLEEPIPNDHRLEIIKRFVERNPKSGFLIHRKGESDALLAGWLDILKLHFKQTAAYDNQHWQILHFTPLSFSANNDEKNYEKL